MKTYSEFMSSLTGTDPVADAREVREYVGSRVSRDWALDMHDAFRGLLISSVQGRYSAHLKRYGSDLPFGVEVFDYDYRESCARLIGLWVLNRGASELKDVTFNAETEADKAYAYTFAMELVIPEEVLRSRLKLDRLNEVCDRFGVPADMLYRRMQELELL